MCPNTQEPTNGEAKDSLGRSGFFILLSPSLARLLGRYQLPVEPKASSGPRGLLSASHLCLLWPLLAAQLSEPRKPRKQALGGCRAGVDPRERLSCNSLGQRMSSASGLSTRWSLQQGEKNLTRHFKPISRRASGEPQCAPDNPICCE